MYPADISRRSYRLHHIAAISDQALEPYRTLRRPLEHRQKGLFVAEGEKAVRRLLEASLQVLSILFTPRWLENLSSDSLLERHPSLDVWDERVAIPMRGSVDSLNVASAAAVFLYEVSRYPRSA